MNERKGALRSISARLLREEHGVALPVSVAVLSLLLLLGAVAVQQAVSAASGTNRDHGVKSGFQAANAGLETALRRMNSFPDELDATVAPCLASNGELTISSQVIKTDPSTPTGTSDWTDCGWEQLGNGESYRYQVSGDLDGDGLDHTVGRQIVATGEAGGVMRRAVVTTTAIDLRHLFGDYTAIADTLLLLENQGDVGSPAVQGNARSNGDIVLSHPNGNIYGDATASGTIAGDGVVGQATQGAEPLEFAPVEMPDPADVDGVVCGTPAECSGWTWDPTSRRLAINGGTAVLTGNTFSLCSLTMTNNSVLLFEAADPTQPIRVYIDSPDNCHDASGNPPAASISLNNRPEIHTAAGLTYPVVQFYVVGDEPPLDDPPSDEVYFSNNNTNHETAMSIYAPRSEVVLENHATIVGGVLAESVSLSNNTALLPPDPDAPGAPLDLPGPEHEHELFRECTSTPPPTGTTPAAGC